MVSCSSLFLLLLLLYFLIIVFQLIVLAQTFLPLRGKFLPLSFSAAQKNFTVSQIFPKCMAMVVMDNDLILLCPLICQELPLPTVHHPKDEDDFSLCSYGHILPLPKGRKLVY